MGVEIERKFLVLPAFHAEFIHRTGGEHQLQAYLSTDPARVVRLRVAGPDGGPRAGTLTVKGAASADGRRRPEWELPVGAAEATEMVAVLGLPALEKVRHRVPFGGLTWEVDVLRVGPAAPGAAPRHLVVAEVEAPDEATVAAAPLPPWVGAEVTGDPRFVMGALLGAAAQEAAWAAALQLHPA